MDYPHVPAELDIWRTVGVLLKHYGAEAESIARQRAEGFIRRGDLEAAAVWSRILTALRTWRADKPPEGERRQ